MASGGSRQISGNRAKRNMKLGHRTDQHFYRRVSHELRHKHQGIVRIKTSMSGHHLNQDINLWASGHHANKVINFKASYDTTQQLQGIVRSVTSILAHLRDHNIFCRASYGVKTFTAGYCSNQDINFRAS